MVELRNGKKVLITPVTDEDLADIKIGDIIYLDGDMVTCRDVAHRRLIEYKRELPIDLHGKSIFHAGPIVRPIPGKEDAYEMVSIGPTTSMRMEKFEKEFVKQTGVKVIIGKGGMSTVYQARDLTTGNLLAVKDVERSATEAHQIVEQSLAAEGKMLKQLSNPHLPKIYDIIENKDNTNAIIDNANSIQLLS